MTNATRKWTDEQIKEIGILYSQKVSMRTMAEKYGVSRNSISGVIWRCIKKKKCSNTKRQPKKVVEKKPKEKMISIPVFKAIPFNKKSYRPSRPVSLFKIKDGMCREILGEPKSLLCCGLPVKRGSFCVHHAKINYVGKNASDLSRLCNLK